MAGSVVQIIIDFQLAKLVLDLQNTNQLAYMSVLCTPRDLHLYLKQKYEYIPHNAPYKYTVDSFLGSPF